jgi:hypothetical protein
MAMGSCANANSGLNAKIMPTPMMIPDRENPKPKMTNLLIVFALIV